MMNTYNNGFLEHLHEIVKHTNGAHLDGDAEELYNCLEVWFIEVSPILETKFEKSVLAKLLELREKAEANTVLKVVKRYHYLLNRLTHQAGLRYVEHE